MCVFEIRLDRSFSSEDPYFSRYRERNLPLPGSQSLRLKFELRLMMGQATRLGNLTEGTHGISDKIDAAAELEFKNSQSRSGDSVENSYSRDALAFNRHAVEAYLAQMHGVSWYRDIAKVK